MIRNIYILLLLSLSYSATLLVPDEYSTIQAAINTSNYGDTVLVSAGTYYENINFNGKNIALIGEDRETTIIDGSNAQPIDKVVFFENGENSSAILEGFTIQGAAVGIACHQSSSPTIRNNIITQNSTEAMHINHSNPLISNTLFHHNNIAIDPDYVGGVVFMPCPHKLDQY